MAVKPEVGEIVAFDVFYPAMLYATGSASVEKQLLHGESL
jgi:hypothetical protein